MKRHYRKGDHKVRDDIYGLTEMASDMRLTWDNKLVHKDFYDVKHPQLIINPRQDNTSINNARPTPEDDASLTFGEGVAEDL